MLLFHLIGLIGARVMCLVADFTVVAITTVKAFRIAKYSGSAMTRRILQKLVEDGEQVWFTFRSELR